MKKKLLITTDCFLPRWDGIARFLAEIIPFLREEFDITVACPRFPGKPPDLGIHVRRYPLFKMRFGDIYFSWPNRAELERLVRGSDVVFNQTIGTIGAMAIRLAKKHDIPIAGYVHSIDWELAARAVKRFRAPIKAGVRLRAKRLYAKADVLLVPSRHVEDELAMHGIRTRRKIIPLGVDTERFVPPVSKQAVKKALGLDPERFVIGYVGRIAREKDLPTLLNAFRRLKRKDAVLLVVGSGIGELSIAHTRITFVDAVDNPVPYYQAMDVFVMPSLTETSSLATMEAMSTGLAVVATPVGSIPEYIAHGKNGLLFPRKNVSALAAHLETLLNNEELRAQLGANARRTMQEQYAWERVAREIRFVLHELSG